MAFQTIVKTIRHSHMAPLDGASFSPCGSDERRRYIQIILGVGLALTLGLRKPSEPLTLQEGTGPDRGKLSIFSDPSGTFKSVRLKTGQYRVCIGAATCAGRYEFSFKRFEVEEPQIIKGSGAMAANAVFELELAMLKQRLR